MDISFRIFGYGYFLFLIFLYFFRLSSRIFYGGLILIKFVFRDSVLLLDEERDRSWFETVNLG